ncbi:MAG: hypothetical protein AAGB46_13765 [Verrucomicrobiota bacterium]
MSPFTHQGGYGRCYLPHYDTAEKYQSITIRLADSLPLSIINLLNEGLALSPYPEDAKSRKRRKRIEQYLDNGYGCSALKHPQVA